MVIRTDKSLGEKKKVLISTWKKLLSLFISGSWRLSNHYNISLIASLIGYKPSEREGLVLFHCKGQKSSVWTNRYPILTNITVRILRILAVLNIQPNDAKSLVLNITAVLRLHVGYLTVVTGEERKFQPSKNCASFFGHFLPFPLQSEYIGSRDPPASTSFCGSSAMPQRLWSSLSFQGNYFFFLHTMHKQCMTVLFRVPNSTSNGSEFRYFPWLGAS